MSRIEIDSMNGLRELMRSSHLLKQLNNDKTAPNPPRKVLSKSVTKPSQKLSKKLYYESRYSTNSSSRDSSKDASENSSDDESNDNTHSNARSNPHTSDDELDEKDVTTGRNKRSTKASTNIEDREEDEEYDEEGDDEECSDEEDTGSQLNTKQNKKQPIKLQKLPIKDALKTVEERSLYTEVDRFFTTKCDQKKIQKMVRIINNEDTISLRLLNWFAMKYSATMEAMDYVNGDGKVELFDVKISYRARLNTHSKKYFDPFRRGKKFDYNYDKRDKLKVVETTLCQLNFFRWMYMHNLMDYVEENFENLKNKMGDFNNQEKKKKETKKEKEKSKKVSIQNKKKDMKLRVKRFNEGSTNKVVIIM